ncbi:MAG: ABC transporter permease [Saprospiraceae bacterium]|nr:ABC transporter permease [Pyrinomonadaceae bacterium]
MLRNSTYKQKKKNKKLSAGLVILAAFYLTAIFADFLAPYDYRQQSRQQPSAPPSSIRFKDLDGNFHLRPFVIATRLSDPLSLRYTEDTSQTFQLGFFVRGHTYNFLGLFPSDLHLFGQLVPSPSSPRIQILGTDNLGRDRFSRLLNAIRFSLIVSPIGTILACVMGILLGVISGYAGRLIDTILMGAADSMMSLPTLILILAARAAFPLELPPLSAAFLLIMIFALTGWAEIARLARGLVWSMREREFVLAARASGLTEARILFRHILPNISRPLLTQATLMFPAFLLAEVALSYLGVGLQEPEVSLGNMLTAANDLNQLAAAPLVLLSPAIVIFLFVFTVRLISDGLKARSESEF